MNKIYYFVKCLLRFRHSFKCSVIMSSSCPSCAFSNYDPDSLALPYIYSITSNRYMYCRYGRDTIHLQTKSDYCCRRTGTHGAGQKKESHAQCLQSSKIIGADVR